MKTVRQSPPVDLTIPYELDWVRGKTILITGGAGGFGAGFLKKWANAGATVIIGDVNAQKGEQLIEETRKESGNHNLHFLSCNVADWQSQVSFFQKAVTLSPHGGIDVVVANAGIGDKNPIFDNPRGLDGPEPPEPEFPVMDVNVQGVLYTTHLALFFLPRNPNSQPADPASIPIATKRDRLLILLGSIASLNPLPGQTLYGLSKHAVLGLFRNMRATSVTCGVRVNLLCPWWTDTAIITPVGRQLIAGCPIGKVEDVVDAATRFVADSRIVGRALFIGPKLRYDQDADGNWKLLDKTSAEGEERVIWEAYADDFEACDVFAKRIVGLLISATKARGWVGYVSDMTAAMSFGVTQWWKKG